MRIISGKFKGKQIISPKDNAIRPTSSIMREAMFNVLISNGYFVANQTKIIDLCCGTGALGIESLSRDAKLVLFIDGSKEHLSLAKQNVENLGALENALFLRADATRLIHAKMKFDLVFIDPPYQKNVANLALEALYNKNWLEDNAIIMVELAKREDLTFDSQKYNLLDEKSFTNSKFLVLEKI
jgi:16S rRNA (guanine966-N2)-methyltransferase